MKINDWQQIVFEKSDLEALVKGKVDLENFIDNLSQFDIAFDTNSDMIFASVVINKVSVKADPPAVLAYRWKKGEITYSSMPQKFRSEVSRVIFEQLAGYSTIQYIATLAARALEDV